MLTHTSSSTITPELLSCLDKPELLDLLLHKTHLFIAATNSKVNNREYFNTLKQELESLQAEIKKRIE